MKQIKEYVGAPLAAGPTGIVELFWLDRIGPLHSVDTHYSSPHIDRHLPQPFGAVRNPMSERTHLDGSA